MDPSLVAMLSESHLQGVGERQAREASSGSDELEEPTEELEAQGHPAIGAHHREVCVDVPVDGHRKAGRQTIQILLELPSNLRGQELPQETARC